MKRPIIIGLAALTLIGLVGCSEPNSTKVESNNTQNTEDVSSNEANDTQEYKNYLGKVDSIVGNQVSIKLIDGDFELTDEMKSALGIFELTEEQKKQLEAGETIELPGGGSMGMASVSGAAEQSEGSFAMAVPDSGMDEGMIQEQEIEIGEDIKAKNEAIFNQIEFNGESKEFTIQAGVPIYNSLAGGEVKLSDIKKGSIVEFIIDEKTNAIISVDIRL